MMFLVVAILLFTGWQWFNYAEKSPGHTPPSKTGTAPNGDGSQERRVSKPAPWPTGHSQRPNFEAGIVFHQWSADGYGLNWQQQLPIVHAQTGARWMEMPIFFSQAMDYSTETQWCDSYWRALQPYVLAAAQAGADQLAIGTELVWLQQHAPAALWNTLISLVNVIPDPYIAGIFFWGGWRWRL